jgi:MFS transporter, SP family, general alpha glucoside:H+ symporter
MSKARNGSISGSVHVDEEQYRRMSVVPGIDGITEDAARGTQQEHDMTLWHSLKLYPKAVGWSVFLSTAIIMEGFDVVLIANLLAVPAFKRAFGQQLPSGDWEITAPWQSGLTNGAYVGEILGLMITGIIADRIGYRKTLIGALVLVTGLIFILFFVKSLEQLLTGLILLGIPWGTFQTLTTTYAADVTPLPLRPYLTTYVNLCWVIGQFLASGVLKGVSDIEGQWAYRIPYALQWIWPIPLIVGIFLAPESPYWLVKHDRIEEAKHSLLRLTSRKDTTFNPDETISMIVHTNELEKAANAGTSYFDCFRGVNFRRTEVCAVTWFIQSWCGSTFMGFSTYFYEQAGLDVSFAFNLSLCQYALGAIGVFCSWGLMIKFGRRTLYVYGLAALCSLLLIIGFCGLAARDNKSAQWAIGSMLLVYTFLYDATVGPVCYSLVAELSSVRLRQKTTVLARNLYNVGSIVGNVLTPRMLNPGAWDWGAKSGLFWAGCCFACFVWAFFRLPEPKGRTYAELDVLFEQKIGARHFATTDVDIFMSQSVRRASVAGASVDTDKKLADKDVHTQVEQVQSNLS